MSDDPARIWRLATRSRNAGECIVVCCGDLEVRHRRDGDGCTVKAEGDKAIIMDKVCNTNSNDIFKLH